MNKSILGQPAPIYKKRLLGRIYFCIAAAVITLCLNILLIALRTDSNHTLMLILNIAADTLCGGFLLFEIDMHILPPLRLYRLMLRQKETLSGDLTDIGTKPRRYMDIDCYEVTVGDRKVFLPAGTIQLQEGPCTLLLVSNIIVEAII